MRKSFVHLFTRKALGKYLSIQERLIRKHIEMWQQEVQKTDKPTELRHKISYLNRLTSQAVFAGPYIDDNELFAERYKLITEGFLSLPLK